MPYKDRDERQTYMRAWKAANGERVRDYRRVEVLKAAMRDGRVPTHRAIQRYSFTAQELQPLYAHMLTVCHVE